MIHLPTLQQVINGLTVLVKNIKVRIQRVFLYFVSTQYASFVRLLVELVYHHPNCWFKKSRYIFLTNIDADFRLMDLSQNVWHHTSHLSYSEIEKVEAVYNKHRTGNKHQRKYVTVPAQHINDCDSARCHISMVKSVETAAWPEICLENRLPDTRGLFHQQRITEPASK